MNRFDLKKLNEVQGKEQYQVKISNRITSLENLNADVNINRAWDTITENVKIYELKKHKPGFMLRIITSKDTSQPVVLTESK
jgi:hypothetical protein